MHYVERVGLDYVKSKVLDDADNRKALAERLLFALQGYKDPWTARAEKGELSREFEPLEA